MQKIKRWTFFGCGTGYIVKLRHWVFCYRQMENEGSCIFTTSYNKYCIHECSPLTVFAFNYFWWLLLTKCVWYSVASCDWKHLENSEVGSQNSWISVVQKKTGNLIQCGSMKAVVTVICIMSRFTTFFGQGIPRHQRNNNNHLTAVCPGQPR